MAATAISSPSFFNKLTRGKPLSLDAHQVIFNVYSSLRKKKPEESITSIVQETAELTGVSKRTVYAIKKGMKVNGKPTPARRTLFRPSDSGKASRAKKYDTFCLGAIRRIVHTFFIENIPPTIEMIADKINDDENLPNIKHSTVRNLLIDLGFVYKRRSRNSALIDRVDIQLARRNYLRSITKHRRDGRTIYYLDETWANAGHFKDFVWQDTTIKSAHQAQRADLSVGLKAPTGKGKRLIITHAGNEEGFVAGARDIFIGKKGSGDYHEEMDGPRFEAWFTIKLLPNIKSNSVIVMDNASYHSVKLEKVPTKSTRKVHIQEWLTEKGIQWSSDMIISELMQLVQEVRHEYDAYRIDTLAKRAGHTVLRLPPYHCELNPIELVWGHVKDRIAAENKSFTLSTVKELAEKALDLETPEMWSNSVDHVVKEEQRFWKIDGLTDNYIESFILNINTGDTDTSDDEDELVSE